MNNTIQLISISINLVLIYLLFSRFPIKKKIVENKSYDTIFELEARLQMVEDKYKELAKLLGDEVGILKGVVEHEQ